MSNETKMSAEGVVSSLKIQAELCRQDGAHDRMVNLLECANIVSSMFAEHHEDQGVIAVWRGRCERAEAERDALIAERDALTDKLSAYNSALEHIAASCDGRAAEVASVAIQMNRNADQS